MKTITYFGRAAVVVVETSGIITSLTFRVHPIKMYQSSLTWEWKDFIAAFQAWQNWAPYIDERLTSSIELFTKQQNKIEAQGEFVGSPSELHSLLSPLLETGTPLLYR